MSDDDERFRNFIMFKFFGTDAELEEMAPWFIAIIIVGSIVLLIMKCA